MIFLIFPLCVRLPTIHLLFSIQSCFLPLFSGILFSLILTISFISYPFLKIYLNFVFSLFSYIFIYSSSVSSFCISNPDFLLSLLSFPYLFSVSNLNTFLYSLSHSQNTSEYFFLIFLCIHYLV